MQTLPAIGQRVRASYGGDMTRTVIGVVTKHYPQHDDDWDEDTDEVIPGPPLPHAKWRVAVEIEGQTPDWWPYGDHRAFAPTVEEVEPLTEKAR